jgi:magnesium transporter
MAVFKTTNFLKAPRRHQSVSDVLTAEVPIVNETATIGEIEMLLSRHAKDFATIIYMYVVDEKRVLKGVVSIREVFLQAPAVVVSTIMTKAPYSVLESDQFSQAVLLSLQHGIKAVPVVNTGGILVGQVTSDAIIAALHTKQIEDTLLQAGSQLLPNLHESILNGTPWLHVTKRLPWLLVGLAGGILAAYIVRLFELTLTEHVLIAAFIPTVVYMADAVGSQTETIFVRAMALENPFKFKPYVARELLVNLALASILSLILIVVIAIWFASPHLATTIGVSIFSTVMLSVLIALYVPYTFARMGFDPAVMSGPVSTTIRDVLTLIVYFAIVLALL